MCQYVGTNLAFLHLRCFFGRLTNTHILQLESWKQTKNTRMNWFFPTYIMTSTTTPVVVPCEVVFLMYREYSNKDFFSPAASNKYGPIEFQSNLYWNLLKFLSPLQCKFSWAILYLKYSSKPFLNILCKPHNLSSKNKLLFFPNQ